MILTKKYIFFKLPILILYLYFILSDTLLASELIEESKLSILNKENEDIKTNG